MKKTTLCYIFCKDEVLLIHRIKKKNDVNEGKYIGLGGHFLEGETPYDCVKREVFEECGIALDNPEYRGIVTFHSDLYPSEEMHLFTATLDHIPPLPECDEGELCMISRKKMLSLKLWEGDLIFLSLLFENAPFFELTLWYQGDALQKALLNGKPSELFDLLDENGEKNGQFKERSLVHLHGDRHATVHIWIYRQIGDKIELLLQKRADSKDAYPGMLDISCAGHLSRGESYEDAAKRELEEELGLGDHFINLRPIGFFDRFSRAFFYGKPFFDNERSMLYLLDGKNCFLQDPPNILSNEELSGVCWIDLELLIADPTLDKTCCVVKEELDMVCTALYQKKSVRQ
ncbi:MAG: NUDIX domain-containing protein [Clostridia bacterium]|nr:NUDIX domain-containing protein [Clostridia bacterium]